MLPGPIVLGMAHQKRFPVSKQTALAVTVSHDKKESVWHVLSSDIPGLHAEAETLDELVAVITDVAPDLVAANMPGTPGLELLCIWQCYFPLLDRRREMR